MQFRRYRVVLMCVVLLGNVATELLVMAGPASQATAAMSLAQSNRTAVLRCVILDILGNPDIEAVREFYGNPGDGRLALVSSAKADVTWPTNLGLTVVGYRILYLDEGDVHGERTKLLGVRLDRLERGSSFPEEGTVEVTILNAGGNPGDARPSVIGGGSLLYKYHKGPEGFSVTLLSEEDS